MAIGVGLPHAATLLIVGLEAEGRLGGGVGVDGSFFFFGATGCRRRPMGLWGFWRPVLVGGNNVGSAAVG